MRKQTDNNDLNGESTNLAKNEALIQTIDIKPGEQRRITLGNFDTDNPTKGFSVEFKPSPKPANSVVSEVSTLSKSKHYEMVMDIINHGTKAVNAEVRQLGRV